MNYNCFEGDNIKKSNFAYYSLLKKAICEYILKKLRIKLFIYCIKVKANNSTKNKKAVFNHGVEEFR